MTNSPKTLDTTELPPPPDLRQSICHTLMAAGFVLLNLLNPITAANTEGTFHKLTMAALGVAIFISWFFFSRRLKTWQSIPSKIRSRVNRPPSDLKQRAFNHLIMTLLAISLTAFALYARLAVPSNKFGSTVDTLLVFSLVIVVVMAVAVLAGTVRDILSASKQLK